MSGSDLWANWLYCAGSDIIVRTGVAPKDLGRWLVEVAPQMANEPFLADMASGLVYTWGDGSALRPPAEKLGGYSIVVAGQSRQDRWGCAPEGVDLMRGLKAKWDPAGRFNPGAFR